MKYYKLHLIRHGLTQGNLDGRYIGSGTDLPLCAEGRAQLEELKAKFQYPDVPRPANSGSAVSQRQAHDFAGPAGDERWQV